MVHLTRRGQNGESTSNACMVCYLVGPVGMTPTDFFWGEPMFTFIFFQIVTARCELNAPINQSG
jgi:hypothetical protein